MSEMDVLKGYVTNRGAWNPNLVKEIEWAINRIEALEKDNAELSKRVLPGHWITISDLCTKDFTVSYQLPWLHEFGGW